jgi:phage terminase small subunit
MNEKQTRFVQEYLVDRVGAAAAVRAGYSPRTARQIAHELLTHVDIAEAVREGEAEIAAHAQLTRAAVLQGFQDAIALARLQADGSAMISGWREIAKMCGFYAPERKQVEVVNTAGLELSAEFEQMTDAQLVNLIADGAEAASG